MPSIIVTGLMLPTEAEALCDALEKTTAREMGLQLDWCVADVLPSMRSKRGQAGTVMMRLITGLFDKDDYKGAPPKLVSKALVQAAQAFCFGREVECMIIHVVGSESSIVHAVI